MSAEADDKFWNEHAEIAREIGMLRPLTAEEAEAAAEEAKLTPCAPLSDEDIRRLVERAAQNTPTPSWNEDADEELSDEWVYQDATESVEGGILQLNRNKGDADPDAEELEEILRRRMLDEEEDSDGMAAGEGPAR